VPRFDGSGPSGSGPLSGKGLGYCVVPLDELERDTIGGSLKEPRSGIPIRKTLTGELRLNRGRYRHRRGYY
jgi:hypothetical protein